MRICSFSSLASCEGAPGSADSPGYQVAIKRCAALRRRRPCLPVACGKGVVWGQLGVAELSCEFGQIGVFGANSPLLRFFTHQQTVSRNGLTVTDVRK